MFMFTRDIRTRVLVHRSETPSFAGCMCINSHLPRYDIQWCRIWRSMDLFPIVGRGRPHGTLSCRHHVLHTCLVASTSHRRQLVSAHLTLTMLGNISSSRAASAAAGSSRGTSDPRSLVRLGMQKFVAGHVEASIEDFDAALALDPSIRPYLWQRGLSLYYVGTEQALRDAALQFREDVFVNPNDTEEAIWAFLCEAKLFGVSTARENFLTVGRDSRPVMRAAYDAFRHGNNPEEIIQATKNDKEGHAAFYSMLYTGLWYEAFGNESQAREAITMAIQTRYAQESGDYMASLAKVHIIRRGWGDGQY